MNILITLSKNLVEKIISGEKKYEMRKSLPKNMILGEDGFFVVEKGTDNVRCWCRVDSVINTGMNAYVAEIFSKDLCVTPRFILDYAPVGKDVCLWQIGKVIELQDVCRNSLCVDINPQQYAYCPLSHGESY